MKNSKKLGINENLNLFIKNFIIQKRKIYRFNKEKEKIGYLTYENRDILSVCHMNTECLLNFKS